MRHWRKAGTIDLSRFEDAQWPINKICIRVQDVASTMTWWGDWSIHFEGRHGFTLSVYGTDMQYSNQYKFSEDVGVRAWAKYLDHLKYYDTLESMVRERMEQSA